MRFRVFPCSEELFQFGTVSFSLFHQSSKMNLNWMWFIYYQYSRTSGDHRNSDSDYQWPSRGAFDKCTTVKSRIEFIKAIWIDELQIRVSVSIFQCTLGRLFKLQLASIRKEKEKEEKKKAKRHLLAPSWPRPFVTRQTISDSCYTGHFLSTREHANISNLNKKSNHCSSIFLKSLMNISEWLIVSSNPSSFNKSFKR